MQVRVVRQPDRCLSRPVSHRKGQGGQSPAEMNHQSGNLIAHQSHPGLHDRCSRPPSPSTGEGNELPSPPRRRDTEKGGKRKDRTRDETRRSSGVVRWAGRCSVTGEGGWSLSFCRNEAVKSLKRLDRMSGGGEKEADPGTQDRRTRSEGFSRGKGGAKGLWPERW